MKKRRTLSLMYVALLNRINVSRMPSVGARKVFRASVRMSKFVTKNVLMTVFYISKSPRGRAQIHHYNSKQHHILHCDAVPNKIQSPSRARGARAGKRGVAKGGAGANRDRLWARISGA